MKGNRQRKNAHFLEEALKLIAGSNHRLTKPRRILLKAVLGQSGPFSAPSLMKTFSGSQGCDPVTIWRTLPLFEKLGIIEKCDFSDEMTNYEVSLGSKGHHHHHIVCKNCRKVEPLEFCVVEGQEQRLNKMGYTQLTHRLEFSGVCPHCSAK